jgi:hypothetical protein
LRPDIGSPVFVEVVPWNVAVSTSPLVAFQRHPPLRELLPLGVVAVGCDDGDLAEDVELAGPLDAARKREARGDVPPLTFALQRWNDPSCPGDTVVPVIEKRPRNVGISGSRLLLQADRPRISSTTEACLSRRWSANALTRLQET